MDITLTEFVRLYGDNIDVVTVNEYDEYTMIEFIDHSGNSIGDITYEN